MSQFIIYLMAVFMLLGALDRILGGRLGLGREFENGIMTFGSLALSMLGIICLAPVLANLLKPVIVPVFRLVGADPDLVLLFSVNGASAMEPKLKELGIPYLYIGDYCEESPIGKAEWLMVLAEVCGLRDKGRSVFDSIPARYEVVRKRAEKVATRPKAMFNAPYRDTWFMPYNSSYALRLVRDAGGQAVYSDNNTRRAVPVTMEQAYLLTDKADVWLVSGTYRTLRELCGDLPRFADTRPVVSGRVFNCTLRSVAGGGNDYWESGIVNPDLVLRDLMKIFHPELVSEPFVYYENLR